jgi:predicted secreted hydrolase
LELTQLKPGWTWGDGSFKSGSKSMNLFLNIPGAQVAGTVIVDGDTLQVKGKAWMDHTVHSDFATHLMESGYRVVSFADGAFKGGYIFESTQSGQWLGYGIEFAPGSDIPNLLSPTDIKVSESKKYLGLKLPTTLTITFEGGKKWQVSVESLRHKMSTLNEFGGFTSAIIKKYMGGEIINYSGTALLNGKNQTLFTTSLVER